MQLLVILVLMVIAVGANDPPTFRVGGTTWLDLNGNGIIDPYFEKEINWEYIMVTLTKEGDSLFKQVDATVNGMFNFTDLNPARYCLEMISEEGKFLPTIIGENNVLDDNGQYCFDITNEDVQGIECGFYRTKFIVMGNARIILDSGGQTLSLKGIIVTVTKDGDTSSLVTTTMDQPCTGDFRFNLVPGRYHISISDPSGNFIPLPRVNDMGYNNGWIEITNEDLFNLDFCFMANPNSHHLSSISGHTSMLHLNISDRVARLDREPGEYKFKYLEPGYYCIDFQGDWPDGYVPMCGQQCVDVPAGTNVVMVDCPFKPVPRFTVHGTFWRDENSDGVKDPNQDQPIKDILVTLWSFTYGTELNTTTDTEGRYQFTDVVPGNYCISIGVTTDLLIPTTISVDSSIMNNGKLPFKIIDRDVAIDGGLKDKPADAIYKVSGQTWRTNDIHHGEDIKVTLTKPGKYCLEMTDMHYGYPPAAHGPNNVLDSNGKYCFEITNKDVIDIDGGFKYNRFGVSGVIWKDRNGDGIMDTSEGWPDRIELIVTKENDYYGGTVCLEGTYFMGYLPKGSYCLKMYDHSGDLIPTTQGFNSEIDSNGTKCFEITDMDITINGGFKNKQLKTK
eukprot:gene19438-23275_t